MNFKRRQFLSLLAALPALSVASAAPAQGNSSIWTVQQTHAELLEDRSAYWISLTWRMERDRRCTRCLASQYPPLEIRRAPVYCSRAGRKPPASPDLRNRNRSGSVMRALRLAGYDDFIDVSEGMLGSDRGPGWIQAGLPVVSIDEAWAALPKALT